MARVGYYILTDEQAEVLSALGISYETLGDLNCVQNWQAVIDQIDALVWEDGDITDEEGAYLDIMSDNQNYLYWSTEAHSWV